MRRTGGGIAAHVARFLWQLMADIFHISLLEFLGMEEMQTEAAVKKISEISGAEKEKLKREFCGRAWLNIAVGTVLFFALLGASYLFHKNGMYGLPQMLTMGMPGMVGLIIGNAVYTLIHCIKLRDARQNFAYFFVERHSCLKFYTPTH